MRWQVAVTLVLLCLAPLCPFAVYSGKADSSYVTVPDDYASIQAAIDAVAEGGTVFVKAGVYVENPVVSKPISLIGEERDTTVVDVTAGLKVESDNVTITGFTFYNGFTGIGLGGVKYCNISGNRITDAKYGIAVTSSSNNEITANLIDNVQLYGYGIQLSYSFDNNVKLNRIISASIGIRLNDELLSPTSVTSTVGNNVSENDITDSQDYGIMITFANSNTFVGNNITDSVRGFSLFESDNNVFYRNNLFNNTPQAVAGLNEPYWNGSSSGTRASIGDWNENFWSDYTGVDANGDGLGDTPYVINEKNADNHPRMEPYATSITLPATPAPYVTASPSPSSPAPTQTSPSSSPSSPASSSPSSQLPTATITELIAAAALTVFGVVVAVAVAVVLWKLHKGKI